MTTDAKLLADPIADLKEARRLLAMSTRRFRIGELDWVKEVQDFLVRTDGIKYVGMPHPDEIISFIIADIRDRKGIGDEWEAIDEDIRNEIIAGWRKFISKRSET